MSLRNLYEFAALFGYPNSGFNGPGLNHSPVDRFNLVFADLFSDSERSTGISEAFNSFKSVSRKCRLICSENLLNKITFNAQSGQTGILHS